MKFMLGLEQLLQQSKIMGKVTIETNDFDLSLGGNGGSGSSAVLEPLTITKNGVYVPQGGIDGFSAVTADVKPNAEVRNQSITANGKYTIKPNSADVMSEVNLNVNVSNTPTQIKSFDITENGTHNLTPDAGYFMSGASVTVAVPPTPTEEKTVEYKANNTFVITPTEGKNLSKVTVNVDVPFDVTTFVNEFIAAGGRFGYSTFEEFPFNIYGEMFAGLTNLSGLFQNCQNLTKIGYYNWNMSSVENMSSMFDGCDSLSEIECARWDVSKVKNMNSLFCHLEYLSEIDVTYWDTSSLENVEYMFAYSDISSLDLSRWKCTKISDMTNMFASQNLVTLIGTHTLSEVESGSVVAMKDLGANTATVDFSGLYNLRYSSYLAIANGLYNRTGLDVGKMIVTTESYNTMKNDDGTTPDTATIAERQKTILDIVVSKNYKLAYSAVN